MKKFHSKKEIESVLLGLNKLMTGWGLSKNDWIDFENYSIRVVES